MSVGVCLKTRLEHLECTQQLIEYGRIALCSRRKMQVCTIGVPHSLIYIAELTFNISSTRTDSMHVPLPI